ncbi:hypothetical protein LGK97_13335 [Clostridium sp. CS001]|uniref:hypothetical protein n=1 Tax=Clostridium sp. CS001 TaxID=2880648 RepID=UPI001CF5F55D|nr:hypothetical protein [Clostridium sp. CS001]MCB2290744.1 hypothetical protein [Clostridium sp. CS001]
MSKCEKENIEVNTEIKRGLCCPGELCSTANAETDLERHGAKLLTVRAVVNNVEANRRVAVAVILMDPQGRILAFRGFTTTAPRGSECDKCKCVTIRRKVVFVLPDDIIDDVSDLEIRVVANYIYPCE